MGPFGPSGLLPIKPFYNPDSFSWSAIGSGTALAALTYIGFDGLTTLSEEVKNPRGNVLLAAVFSLALLVGSIGSGSTGQMGAARLLYGMGRDGVLPRGFFARLDRKHAGPSLNILFVGALALAGAAALNYEEAATLLTFGAV